MPSLSREPFLLLGGGQKGDLAPGLEYGDRMVGKGQNRGVGVGLSQRNEALEQVGVTPMNSIKNADGNYRIPLGRYAVKPLAKVHPDSVSCGVCP